MRHRRTTTALAAAAVGAALIATGCGSSSAANPTPTSAPTTTTATTTAATPSDTAIDQAKQTITGYFRVYDQLGQNPAGADPATINTVAAGQAVASLNTGVQGLLRRGLHSAGGDTSITRWTVHDANITNADAEVAADVCYDVSKTQVLDAKGTPQPRDTMQAAAPDGSDTIISVPWRDQRLARFIVHNSSWPDPAGWRVTQVEMRNAPCE